MPAGGTLQAAAATGGDTATVKVGAHGGGRPARWNRQTIGDTRLVVDATSTRDAGTPHRVRRQESKAHGSSWTASSESGESEGSGEVGCVSRRRDERICRCTRTRRHGNVDSARTASRLSHREIINPHLHLFEQSVQLHARLDWTWGARVKSRHPHTARQRTIPSQGRLKRAG